MSKWFYTVCLLASLFMGSVGESQDFDVERERLVLKSLVASIEAAEENDKSERIRALMRFPTEPTLREQVFMVPLGYLMIATDSKEDVRRQAAKALLAMSGETKSARALIPLLREDQITQEMALRAMWLSGSPHYIGSLKRLLAEKNLPTRNAMTALKTLLSLWFPESCGDPLTNGSEAEKMPMSTESMLKAIADPSDFRRDGAMMKANLILACRGDQRARTRLTSLLEERDPWQQKQAKHFLGYLTTRENEETTSR